MKNYKFLPYFLVATLMLAQLSCQLVSNLVSGQEAASQQETQVVATQTQESEIPTLAPMDTPQGEEATEPTSEPVESEFPLPPDAENVVRLGEGMINFQVKMSLKEAIAFYQTAFAQQGLSERTILHVETENTFNLVFDGAPNGKAIVVQGVDLGDGTLNINIRYEDV